MQAQQPTSRLKSSLTILGVSSVFLGFAALVTLAAPTYILSLSRQDNRVDARIQQQLLWVIPVRVQTLTGLKGTATETEEPASAESLRRPGEGPSVNHQAEIVGHLILKGNGGDIRAMVSPEQHQEIIRAINDFLADKEPALRLWLVANWKFAVLAPGIVTLPGVLLLLLHLWDVAHWLRHPIAMARTRDWVSS